MKFKAKDTINLRSGPSLESPSLGKVPAGTVVDSDAYAWKLVTLPGGKKGYVASDYLEEFIPLPSAWCAPIRGDKYLCTQKFLEPDAVTYPKTGHHPGVDYGTGGKTDVPAYFCADGEVVESGVHPQFGNYFFFYVPEVDRTFVYFHLKSAAPAKGLYGGGAVAGTVGNTGLSYGVHLHLECMKGKQSSASRAKLYTSKAALMAAAEDADVFIRARLG